MSSTEEERRISARGWVEWIRRTESLNDDKW